MPEISNNLLLTSPLLVLLGLGLVLMLLDAFKAHRALPWVTGIGLVVSGLMAAPGLVIVPSKAVAAFGEMLQVGGTAGLIHLVLCSLAVLSLLFVAPYLNRQRETYFDFYALLVFSVLGMILLASASHLIILFVGLETMSVCLYIMAALFRRDERSVESGFKYFLLGAFASAFLLFGIALLYGLAGSMAMVDIQQAIFTADPSASIAANPMFYPAIGLVLIGFLFKVAAFPFHAWTPDVYTGAPTPIAGFMNTGAKLAAFVALIFFLLSAVPAGPYTEAFGKKGEMMLGAVALLSMLYGNLVAMRQDNLKRMLAYSSIAHSGYLLVGLISGPNGWLSMVFYLVVYAVMTLGAFGILSILEKEGQTLTLKHIIGMGKKQPLLAAVLSLCMLSLAGIPPLGGFFAKYMLFGAAFRTGLELSNNALVALAAVGVMTSIFGVFYYLRVISALYFRKTSAIPELDQPPIDADEGSARADKPGLGPALASVLVGSWLLLVGVLPSLMYDMIARIYAGDGLLTVFLQ